MMWKSKGFNVCQKNLSLFKKSMPEANFSAVYSAKDVHGVYDELINVINTSCKNLLKRSERNKQVDKKHG